MTLPSFLKPSRFISPLRARQIHRALRNLKLTMICGFLTILVLRGTLGAGKFGTPAKDFEEIKYQFERVHSMHMHKHASRVLAEVVEERSRPLEAILVSQAQSSTPKNADADVEATLSPTKPYSLGPKVSDWDAQRKQARSNLVASKPDMMLVTGSQPSVCENPAGDHFLLKYTKNKIDYCRLHGIEIFYNMAHLDTELSGFWAKLPLLRKLMLTHSEVEWFWWMDSDAIFTDMAFELPMEKYENYNLVLHGWDDMVYKKKNWIGLNTGSFLIRNCQWSLDLLDAWATMGPEGKVRDEAGKLLAKTLTGGRPPFEADDQSALVYLLTNEKEKWGGEVYLESSFYLHGYWKVLVEQYEEIMEKNHNGVGDERWPFVTHFVGCKPCKKANRGDYNAEQCFKHMERAFNFADNQVLEFYGFQHKSLSSSAVLHLRGSDDSLAERPVDGVRPLLHRPKLTTSLSSS